MHHHADRFTRVVCRDIVRALLFEMVGALLARPPDVDLLDGWIVVDNVEGACEHALVAVFVALG